MKFSELRVQFLNRDIRLSIILCGKYFLIYYFMFSLCSSRKLAFSIHNKYLSWKFIFHRVI